MRKRLHSHRYILLLISLLLILFVPSFIKDDEFRSNISSYFLMLNVLVGFLILGNTRSIRTRIIQLIFAFTLLMKLLVILGMEGIQLLSAILYIIYFIAISIHVYRDIYMTKEVDSKMLAAVFCGFIMLGVLASFAFLTIESINPGSFSGLTVTRKAFNDLIYFSFISLLTIGYGDITPASEIAKSMSVFAGLLGHFYTVIVTGIIIGKFLSKKN